MIGNPRTFSPLRYLSLTLLVAPFVLMTLAGIGFVARLKVPVPFFMEDADPGTAWLTVAVAGGVVCALCEWFVLPFVLPRHHPRPAYTPFISLGVGLVVAVLAFLLLRSLFFA
jgi:hypothetical protein